MRHVPARMHRREVRGRSPSRAIANVVRPTPAMSARSAPSEAAAAPTRTTGSAQAQPDAATAVGDRLGDAAVASGPSVDSTVSDTAA